MIMVDTSAWIEYFKNSTNQAVKNVDYCLQHNLIAMGDLIYCEIMQGIKDKKERDQLSSLLLSLPKFDMVGFEIAAKSAENYRRLRFKGITVRKTIDVLIATFCIEKKFQIIHNDRDFDVMSDHLGLEIYSLQ